ncbi:MAG: site-specific integrase [Burkholderiaceae bacterium]|nr:site-specific integrase [Burkholderiaceae bacterium]
MTPGIALVQDEVKAPQKKPHKELQERKKGEAQALFTLDSLQHLDRESVVRCQSILGHGDQFGIWQTPSELIGGRHLVASQANLDLRKQLLNWLPEEFHSSSLLPPLLEEGVLWLSRYALLLRMGPTGTERRGFLDVTTILRNISAQALEILALGIEKRLAEPARLGDGFICHLSENDWHGLASRTKGNAVVMLTEKNRLRKYADLGLWSDAPAKIDLPQTTNPSGAKKPSSPEIQRTPFPVIPDDYLAEMGPLVLWIVRELGPNLLKTLEDLPDVFADVKFEDANILSRNQSLNIRIVKYFEPNPWRDRNGDELAAPPFLNTLFKSGVSDVAWPPKTRKQLSILCLTLQTSHLWIALLAMGGRISEISTLKQDCVEVARDGNVYVNGKTFKLSSNFDGIERQWPAPAILVQALAQQSLLGTLYAKMQNLIDDTIQHEEIANNALWRSLGVAGTANPNKQLQTFNGALTTLAERLGMPPKPGGKNLHCHRFRKTIARLAGLAIVDSPRVLMQLLGHKDIEMTMSYMLTDKAFQMEVDQVARELRVMRCEEVIENMHEAMHSESPLKFGGYGGGAAQGMWNAVRQHEEALHRDGKRWDADSAYDLAVKLTSYGQSYRIPLPGVVCLSEKVESKPCTCDATCGNRLYDMTARRDVEQVIPILIKHGQQALADGEILVVAYIVEQLDTQIERFDDIRDVYQNHPELISLREAAA